MSKDKTIKCSTCGIDANYIGSESGPKKNQTTVKYRCSNGHETVKVINLRPKSI